MFSSSNLLLVCLLQSEHKRGLDFYNIFNSSDLTLLFDLVPVFFIFYLRKTKKINMTVHVLNYNSSFSIDTGIFIFKRLYHTSFKLNIVNLSRALPSGPPLNLLRSSQCAHTPQELFLSQSMQNT